MKLASVFDLSRYGPPPAPETLDLCRKRRRSAILCMSSTLAIMFVHPIAAVWPPAVLFVGLLLVCAVMTTGMYWRDKNRLDEAHASAMLLEWRAEDAARDQKLGLCACGCGSVFHQEGTGE